MRHVFPFAACILSFLLLTGTAGAQVNGFAVCNDNSLQTNPEMVADGSGGVIIAWVDGRNGAGNARIYAQRVNAAGVAQWTANGVAVSAITGNDAEPCIVSDGAGGAIIAWQHNTPNGIIYVQRLNSSGALQWPTTGGPKNGVQLTISGSGSIPVITTDGTNGAIVAWRDFRGALNTYDIYASRVTSTGVVPWTSGGVVVCNAANDQDWPVIVTDAAGGAILAWLDKRSGFDTYMERLNSAGSLQWGSGSGVLLGSSTSSGDSPAITTDAAGGAIVAWETDAVNFNVIVQRVDGTGAAQWGVGTLVCTAANLQLHPQIVADGASGVFVTWQDTRTNSSGDAYIQHVNAAGVSQWVANGVVLTAGNAESPVVTTSGSGALVTWIDTRNTIATQHDLYAHAVAQSGSVGFPADGTPVCTMGDDQIAPRIVYSSGNAFITWQDRRSGGWDIYALVMSVATAVGDMPPLSAWALGPNYPNPFLERTTMNLDLAVRREVKIDVFDVAGHRVRQENLGGMSAGRRELTFDGRDDAGRLLPSGVYFYRVRTGSQTVTRKMVIAR